MEEQEILARVTEILVETFELDAEDVTPDAKLYEELGLDSIDAVDIFVQLRELTGRRPDPAVAREIRSVAELLDFVKSELAAADRGEPEADVARPGSAPEAGTSSHDAE